MTKFTTDWEDPFNNDPPNDHVFHKYLIDEIYQNNPIAEIFLKIEVTDEGKEYKIWKTYIYISNNPYNLLSEFATSKEAKEFVDNKLIELGFVVIPEKLKIII